MNVSVSPFGNLVPMVSVVEREVEGPGKAGCHIFQNIWKVFLPNRQIWLTFGHVTTSLCQGLSFTPETWEGGCSFGFQIN